MVATRRRATIRWAPGRGKERMAAQGDAWLSAVTVPVHLLVGDHDRVPDVAHLRELAGRHEDLRLSIVNGADHDLPLTHAATIVSALRGAVPAK